MTELKIGDRVRIRAKGRRIVGTIDSICGLGEAYTINLGKGAKYIMTNEIKLGELEIAPQMLMGISMNDSPNSTSQFGMSAAQATRVANEVNRILREKLSNAPRAWGHEDIDFGVMVYFDDEEAASENTHTARLVCITEIKP